MSANESWHRLRPSVRIVMVLVVIGVLGVLGMTAYKWFPGRRVNAVEAPKLDAMVGKYVKEAVADVPKIPLPSGDELGGKMFATINVYDWHANTALSYAVGGERTLENSILGKEGLVVKLAHQDDTNVSIKSFLEKAAEYKSSGGKSGGNLMFTIMGGAAVPLIEPLQEDLKKIDPTYQAVGVDIIGKSDGEDQVIGPVEWKTNPELMRGKVVIGVYDDEDVALHFIFADKVNIPVNFDYKTYNPNGLNIANVADFIKAGKDFVSIKKLDPRPIVDDQGRRTGKTSGPLDIDSVASWTPVDRNIVRDLPKVNPEKYRNLGTIVSTGQGEERKVMPCVVIALNKWVDSNRSKLENFSFAVHVAAVQIDRYPDALMKAMEINTAVMGIWDAGGSAKEAAEQRLRAFKGYNAPSNKNLHVGGSAVFSFRDAMNMVGMSDVRDDVANSTYASVYRSLGNLTVRKFPEKNITSYLPFEQFFDSRILRGAYQRAQREGYDMPELVARRSYSDRSTSPAIGSVSKQITFRTGSAEIDTAGLKVLQEVQDNYAASEYPIKIVGHTDRTGSDAVNNPLSESRAGAVRNFLVAQNNRDFGGNRIATEGKGSSEPPKGVDPHYQGECAVCRRVEIIIYQ